MSDPPTADERRNLAQWWPVIAQVIGVALIATGFGLLALWAGIAVGGLGMLAAGTVAELTHDRGQT